MAPGEGGEVGSSNACLPSNQAGPKWHGSTGDPSIRCCCCRCCCSCCCSCCSHRRRRPCALAGCLLGQLLGPGALSGSEQRCPPPPPCRPAAAVKSALQKNVRLCRPGPALRCAALLLKEDAGELLRRCAPGLLGLLGLLGLPLAERLARHYCCCCCCCCCWRRAGPCCLVCWAPAFDPHRRLPQRRRHHRPCPCAPAAGWS
jgi:hypothetical protein